MSLHHDSPALFPTPCPVCDGAGEWDEGPLPASSGATEPDFRQVICPECEGKGSIMAEAEPRTFDDLVDEADESMAALDATLAALRVPASELLKPTCDEDGNWRYVPASEIDGQHAPPLDDVAREAVEGEPMSEVA